MIGRHRLPLGAGLLVILLGLVAGGPGAAAGAPAATAAVVTTDQPQTSEAATPSPQATGRTRVGAGSLAVRIESITPSVPHKGDTLTLTGTIANGSERTVTAVRAVLRVSPTPLASRGEIAEILAGEGQRVGSAVPGRTATDDVAASLTPGGAASFSLSVPVDDLRLPSAGAYMVGVEAVGDAGSGPVRQDIDRSFLPWWPGDTAAAHLLLTLLWPLAGAPLRDATGVLLSEEPAVEMSPSGRLDVLLDSVAAHPGVASIVVDPQVLQAADDLSDGYLVAGDDDPTPGSRSREIARWLQTMRAVAADSDQSLDAMLYGQPDVVAARHGRALGALLRQRPLADELSADALGRSLDSQVVLAPGGAADETTLRTLAGSDVGTVVLSDATMPPMTPSFFTPSGNVAWRSGDETLPVLLTDSGLDATLRMPMTSSSEQVAARQRLLAETLTTTLELRETQRLLVAAPPADWSPPTAAAVMVLDTLQDAPWVEPTSLKAATAREPSTVARQLAAYSDEAAAAEIPAESVSRARARGSDLTSYAGALSEPSALPAVTRTAPTRVLSSWFRGRQDEQDELLRAVSRQTREVLRSVRIVSSGAVITVSGSSGTIPVTVENVGPAAVTIGLTLTSSPAQLFSADPVAPFRIDPGKRTSVEVQAEVNAAGPIPVTIQATTASGDEFGVPGSLTVSSSAYASAARVLVQASLAILLLTVLVHGVRRARRRGARRRSAPVAAQPQADAPGHQQATGDSPEPAELDPDVEVPHA